MNGSGKQSALLQHSASRFGAAAAVATHGSRVPTKPHPNETTSLTLNPRSMDRAPAFRGAGLCAVALGAWGLGAVTP